MKNSIRYLQYLKHKSKCCSTAITEASRLEKCPIARSINSIRRKHVWHHEWRHREYLTWAVLQRILILDCLRILWHLRSTRMKPCTAEQQFMSIMFTDSMVVHFFSAPLCLYNSQHGEFLSASLYFSKRGAYWNRLCRDVVGRWLVVTRVHCGQTVHPRPIVTMEH